MIKINTPFLKYPIAALALTGALLYPQRANAQLEITETTVSANGSVSSKTSYPATDVFVRQNGGIPPQGTSDDAVLANAPSPNVVVQGKMKRAKIVVDLSTNVLYHYGDSGEPLTAYLIASGRRTGKEPTPTHKGLRVVSHKETYPYRNAPSYTKRYKNPKDYGPMIILLRKLDAQTGETSDIGEFIHGNGDASLLGRYVSHGCMRMDNDVIKYLAPKMKPGDIVLIK
jgi:lipoprotein-anchoring transpeptidase ErfK/SrfK